MIKTIFFDFDGVVIDSEPIHAKTKALALECYGVDYPEDIFDKYKGVPEDKFFIYVSEHLDFQHRPYSLLLKKRHEYLLEMLPEMPVIDGFFDFMEFIKLKKIRAVLVTSSTKSEIANIDKYLNLTCLFDKIISAEATPRHKPDPAPYLKALEIMDIDKEEAIIIEDSPNGIIAGKGAGCKVYALTTTFPKEELIKAGADDVFENYKDLESFIAGL